MTINIAAFYKFVRIEEPEVLRNSLGTFCCRQHIKGTILIASEGINATVSGSAAAIDALLAELRADPRFTNLDVKLSEAGAHPFQRLKVKVKPEILTFGHPEAADPTRQVGTYVAPADWNHLIAEPDVLLIDTRNAYECAVGTFPRAVDPGTRTFGEFAAYVDRHLDPARHKRVAMFCTGGIRCEKASAYLKSRGFPEVYHLEGGILRYLETVPSEESRWQGECFVFDERVAVGPGLAPACAWSRCPVCGQPVTAGEACDCRQ